MIGLFLGACVSAPSFEEQKRFSPALWGIVESMFWRYETECMGLEAYWSTKLPEGTKVQVMIGPKTQNPHFDDDAIFVHNAIVQKTGIAQIHARNIQFPSQPTFINLRVWGNTTKIRTMLEQSQQKGGFPVAQSPEGPYGWAETTIPPCTK